MIILYTILFIVVSIFLMVTCTGVLFDAAGMVMLGPYLLSEYIPGCENLPELVQTDMVHYMWVLGAIIAVISCVSTFTRKVVFFSSFGAYVFWLLKKVPVIAAIMPNGFTGVAIGLMLQTVVGFAVSFIYRAIISFWDLGTVLKEYDDKSTKRSVWIGFIPAVVAAVHGYAGSLMFWLLDDFQTMTIEEGVPFITTMYIFAAFFAVVVTTVYAFICTSGTRQEKEKRVEGE